MVEETEKTQWNDPPLGDTLTPWSRPYANQSVKRAEFNISCQVTIEGDPNFRIRAIRDDGRYRACYYECVYLVYEYEDGTYSTCYSEIDKEWLDAWGWMWGYTDGKNVN